MAKLAVPLNNKMGCERVFTDIMRKCMGDFIESGYQSFNKEYGHLTVSIIAAPEIIRIMIKSTGSRLYVGYLAYYAEEDEYDDFAIYANELKPFISELRLLRHMSVV